MRGGATAMLTSSCYLLRFLPERRTGIRSVTVVRGRFFALPFLRKRPVIALRTAVKNFRFFGALRLLPRAMREAFPLAWNWTRGGRGQRPPQLRSAATTTAFARRGRQASSA